MSKLIEVSGLSKAYGKIDALDNISFKVDEGEILGLLGPNGAGKSTTMNIITGYLGKTSGTVLVDGIDVSKKPMEAKKKIGYLPEIPPLYTDMTVEKFLRFVFDLKGLELPKKEHIGEIMKTAGISDVSKRLIKNLSKGYKQRVGFAQALLGYPPVLVLDEPTVGLDPSQIIEFRKLIKSLGKKHTIIFSSHILSEVSEICDRIVVISNGRVVTDEKTSQLSSKFAGAPKVTVEIQGTSALICPAIRGIDGVLKTDLLSEEENSVRIQITHRQDVDIRQKIFSLMAEMNHPILEMGKTKLSLEELYLQLTSSSENSQVDKKVKSKTKETDKKRKRGKD